MINESGLCDFVIKGRLGKFEVWYNVEALGSDTEVFGSEMEEMSSYNAEFWADEVRYTPTTVKSGA